LFGWARPALLYGMIALASAATAFDNPARQALTVNLLPPKDLPGGLALGILGWQVATVIGPALGGVLLAATSGQTIYSVDAISFGAVLGALAIVGTPIMDRGRRPEHREVRRWATLRGFREDSLAAIRFLRSKPALVRLMLLDFFATFFAGSLLLLP